jgi:hypothetical protein
VKVGFDVNSDGKVSNSAVLNCTFGNKESQRRILLEINAWTFPQLKNNASSHHVEREFWF